MEKKLPEKITKEFIDYIRKEAHNPEPAAVFAQMLKVERLKRNLTLQEAAEGICSVSYLSKLENHIIDNCNEALLRPLCERFDIDYDTVIKINDISRLKQCVNAYFYHDYQKIDQMFHEMNKISFTASQGLISCFYYMINDDYDSFAEEIKNIDAVKFTLSNLECFIYIFVLSEYYCLHSNYKRAYEYIKQIIDFDITDITLKMLLIENYIISSFHLGRYTVVIMAYRMFEGKLYLGYPEGRRIKIKLIYDLSIIEDYPDVAKMDIEALKVEGFSERFQNDILFYIMIIKIKLAVTKEDYQKLFDELLKLNKFDDNRFLGLISYLAYLLNMRNYYRQLESLYKDFAISENVHTNFAKYVLYYASVLEDEILINFVKTNYISQLDYSQHYLYNETYIKTFVEMLAIDNKYKDAYLYSSGVKKDLKDIVVRMHVLKEPK